MGIQVNTTKVNMAPVELQCPVLTCVDDDGTRYKTEKVEVEVDEAMRLMEMHNAATHPVAQPPPARIGGGDGNRFQELESSDYKLQSSGFWLLHR
jgi:hypothetical protein